MVLEKICASLCFKRTVLNIYIYIHLRSERRVQNCKIPNCQIFNFISRVLRSRNPSSNSSTCAPSGRAVLLTSLPHVSLSIVEVINIFKLLRTFRSGKTNSYVHETAEVCSEWQFLPVVACKRFFPSTPVLKKKGSQIWSEAFMFPFLHRRYIQRGGSSVACTPTGLGSREENWNSYCEGFGPTRGESSADGNRNTWSINVNFCILSHSDSTEIVTCWYKSWVCAVDP